MKKNIPPLIIIMCMLLASYSFSKSINFTAEEGYVDGELTAHALWQGTPGCIIDTQKGIVKVPTDYPPNFRCDQFLAYGPNSTHTLGVSFCFKRNPPQLRKKKLPLFRLGITSDAMQAAGVWFLRSSKTNTKSTYSIQLASKLGEFKSHFSKPINDELIHSNSDSTSDQLYLELRIKTQQSPTNCLGKASLYNLTTDPQKQNPLASLSLHFNIEEKVFYNEPLYFYISSGLDPLNAYLETLSFDYFLIETNGPNKPEYRGKKSIPFPTANISE